MVGFLEPDAADVGTVCFFRLLVLIELLVLFVRVLVHIGLKRFFRVHRDLSGENLVLAFFCRFAGQTIPDIRLIESEVFDQCCYGRIDVRMGIVLFFIFYRRIGKFTVENNVVNLLTRCQNRSVPVGDTSPLEWNCPAAVGLLRLA